MIRINFSVLPWWRFFSKTHPVSRKKHLLRLFALLHIRALRRIVSTRGQGFLRKLKMCLFYNLFPAGFLIFFGLSPDLGFLRPLGAFGLFSGKRPTCRGGLLLRSKL